MKKRILLSLVSFFAMTAMWASLVEAYQIYVTAGANGKTGATAELTLNMKNKDAGVINIWECTVVLPTGVTYEDGSVAVVDARYPEGYNPVITATVNADGSVTFLCYGEEGFALTGTDGAVATFSVKIAGDVEPGDKVVTVKGTKLTEVNGSIHQDLKGIREFTWTIEQGEQQGPEGDLNGDEVVDIADAVTVLNIMASGEFVPEADLNGDQQIDIADFVTVLNIMAAQ